MTIMRPTFLRRLLGMLAAGWLVAALPLAFAQTPEADEIEAGIGHRYVQLDDIRMYYKSAGEGGEAVLFLHGGFGNSDIWLDYFDQLPGYHLIAPDSRGQGRTTIGEGPVTYGRMAADVIRLLDHLEIPKAHVVGFSDGGCIALQLLVDYADRVSSAVLVGTPYHTDNYPPEVYAGLQRFIAGLREPSEPTLEMRKEYWSRLAPEPEAWPALVERLGSTWLSQPSFNDAELEYIDRPVLVVKVDRDQYLPPAVFDRTAELIPRSRVLHLPEGTHYVLTEMPGRLGNGLRDFLRDNAIVDE